MSVLTDSRVCFQRGQSLGENDLNIRILDNSIPPVPTDPFDIKYSIFDRTSGIPVLVGLDRLDPVRKGTGHYYISWGVPADANIGDWQAIYYIKDTPTSQEQRVILNFCVVNPNVVTFGLIGSLSPEGQELVRRLRVILRDNCFDGNTKLKVRTDENEEIELTIAQLWEIIGERD